MHCFKHVLCNIQAVEYALGSVIPFIAKVLVVVLHAFLEEISKTNGHVCVLKMQ